jgi:hypothetical protein
MSTVKFHTIDDFRTGQPVDLLNTSFTFDNGYTLSALVKHGSETTLYPDREIVEIAILDERDNGEWVTEKFYREVMKTEIDEDIAYIYSKELIAMMHRVSRWGR